MQSLASAQLFHGSTISVIDRLAGRRRRAADGEADQRRVRVAPLAVLAGIRAEILEHQRVRPLPHDAGRRAHPQSAGLPDPVGDGLQRVEETAGVGPQHVARSSPAARARSMTSATMTGFQAYSPALTATFRWAGYAA